MVSPISIEVDLEVGAGYVYYHHPIADGGVSRSERLGDGVNADYNAAGILLGIELLALDTETLARAGSFATSHDHAFPLHLAEALTLA